jgi:hypothetical protein
MRRGASMNARRLTLTTLTTLCAALGALAFSTAPALALETHKFSTSFGMPVGDVPLSLASTSGVAVNDETGDIYITDTGNARIDEFNSEGEFVLTFGREVNKTAVMLSGTEAEQNLCTAFSADECQRGASGSGPGQFTTPVFVAVDNSAGASKGDVYVGDTGDDLVTKFSASGALIESWGTKGQLKGSPTLALGALAGIAVGAAGTGTLYVFNDQQAHMFEFEQNGSFITEFDAARGTTPNGLAVDSAGDFFKVNGDPSVEKITGSSGDLGQVTPGPGEGVHVTGVAVDGTDLYAAEAGSVRHYVFTEPNVVSERGGLTCTIAASSPCPAIDSFASGAPNGGSLTGGSGIGVDSANDDVYVADAAAGHIDVFLPTLVPTVITREATQVKAATATLHGAVNPEGLNVTDCHFDYVAAAEYNASAANPYGAGGSAACEETVGSGTEEVSVTAKPTGLNANTTYHFVLQAENTNAAPSFGEDATFKTPPPPAIAGAATSNLTATSVDLNARITAGGLDTTYRFEYGNSTAYGTSVPTPDADIGEGESEVSVVPQRIEGLSPNVTYHWRVVAHNEAGTTIGSDHTFIYSVSGGGLPDNRAYELVSPTQKNGARIGNYPFAAPAAIAENGSRTILGSLQCFAAAGSCPVEQGSVGSLYSFTRTAGGWVTTALSPSAAQFETNGWANYDADTGMALFHAPTPPLGVQDLQERQLDGSFIDIGPLSPPEDAGNLDVIRETGPEYATADFSHIVTRDSFFSQEGGSLVEYAGTGTGGAAPAQVGVSGGLGSTDLISACESSFPHDGSGRMSADGRIAYFNARPCPSGGTGANQGKVVPVSELYARVDGGLPDAHTVAISQPKAIASSPADENCTTPECQLNITEMANWREAAFKGASDDGSKVFFIDEQQLTNDASENFNNLYLYDFDNPSGHNLIDVSAGDTSGKGPRLQGVMADSSDGSHVYFVAQGVLTTATNAQGQSAQDGADNLYMFERDGSHPGGRAAFIATLPALESGIESETDEWRIVGDPANVTPDGRFLVFKSEGALTPDVPRAGTEQIYRYDAQTEELVRISIGEHGFNDNGFGGPGRALIAPAVEHFALAGAARRDPTMSHDGSYIFFMSPVALTPQASNSVQTGFNFNGKGTPLYAENVYEYHDGNVYLISDGRDTGAANAGPCETGEGSLVLSAVCLLGSDATGANVFFTTGDQLLPQDTDTQLDVYDARICTAESPCIPPLAPAPPPCLGEACHGIPPAPPSLLTPGSSFFNGAGNIAPTPTTPAAKPKPPTRAQKLAAALRVCRKDKKRSKRMSCERLAAKRYGAKSKAKSAGRERGARS